MEGLAGYRTWDSQDVKKLVVCLEKLPPVSERDEVKFDTAAEKLLDCVLSLNRRYDGFAAPGVRKFGSKHPFVTTLADLRTCIARGGGPVAFYKTQLDYDWAEAAEMFQGVLDYLLKEMGKFSGTTDLERLHGWALFAKVEGHKEASIPLFGIAGWQYLRMLFGADTCKPDIAVKRFVKDCLKRRISGIAVVRLMETAAPAVPGLRLYDRPVREGGRSVWPQAYRPIGEHVMKLGLLLGGENTAFATLKAIDTASAGMPGSWRKRSAGASLCWNLYRLGNQTAVMMTDSGDGLSTGRSWPWAFCRRSTLCGQ